MSANGFMSWALHMGFVEVGNSKCNTLHPKMNTCLFEQHTGPTL